MKKPKLLIDFLKQRKFSQDTIAKKIGVSQMTISRLEAGKSSRIDVEAYMKLLSFYEREMKK